MPLRDHLDEIEQRYRSGETLRSIASSYGVSHQRVKQVLVKYRSVSGGDGGKKKQIRERDEIVKRLAEDGLTVTEIADRIMVPIQLVYGSVNRIGVDVRNSFDIRADRIFDLWFEGLTQKQIADQLGTTQSAVGYTLINRFGIRSQPGIENESAIIARYQAGETQKQIADDLVMSQEGVSLVLRRNGIAMRGRPKPGIEHEREIIDRYKGGESYKRIADSLSMSKSGVEKVLKRNGISRRMAGRADNS